MGLMQFKIHRVLFVICIAFFIIAARILHLSVFLRDNLVKDAERPKLKSMLLKADRGEIWDRFNIPLAQNRICYNAAIYYSQITQIPSRGFSFDDVGNRIRTSPRKQLIQDISNRLSQELDMDATFIEDLIYSKASLFPHVPFIIKSHITEEQYYRLKMLEKDLPGLFAEIGSERYYPQGKVACHIVGTLGAISQEQYFTIAEELTSLQEIVNSYESSGSLAYLPEEFRGIEDVYERLENLKQKAYSINDRVGKTGVEAKFEEDLRGYFGTKKMEVDNLGKPLKELSNMQAPVPGNTVVLTISSELQQFAEELLIQSERERDNKSCGYDPIDNQKKQFPQPWIKGGAIVAMDPKSGEILALASTPRFDPNDFVSQNKSSNTHRWLETQVIQGQIWDGIESLCRETKTPNSKKVSEELTPVSWEFYLSQILPNEGPLKSFFEKNDDIKSFVQVQEDFSALLYFAKTDNPIAVMDAITFKNSPLYETLKSLEEASVYLKRLDSTLCFIQNTQDRLFVIDLCRLCIDSTRFSDELILKIGTMKISTYRLLTQAYCRFAKKQKEIFAQKFHQCEFAKWREENQKPFIQKMRLEEKEKKTFAKPYIEYLNLKENEMFTHHWEESATQIIYQNLKSNPIHPDAEMLSKTLFNLPEQLAFEMMRSFRSFQDLDRPLFSKTASLKTEKDLARAFYPIGSFGYSRSYAFQASSALGSMFKVLVSYEALKQGHNPILIDTQKFDPSAPAGKKHILAYSANNTPYPRSYKGGRLPKSKMSNIGKIDITGALECSSNPYFSILAGDYLKSPEDLNDAALHFGFGRKSGIDIPGEVRGNIPTDLKTYRTGLYSYAIGQHTLLSTPLQASLMLATLSNEGRLLKPQIVKAVLKEDETQETHCIKPVIRDTVAMPISIRNTIYEGMDKCVWGTKGGARPSAIKSLIANPVLMHDFLQLEHQMIGKTSSAEILYHTYKHPSSKPLMYQHIWFGSIGFAQDSLQNKTRWETPEIIVVVYLRYSDAGKEAAPLAAQMIRKWREIEAMHKTKNGRL